MQLFTIGLVELNQDGTPKIDSVGKTTDAYTQSDITGLARVFTGWDFDLAGKTFANANATPDLVRRPMVQVASRYEVGAKSFLRTTIDAGTPAVQSLARRIPQCAARRFGQCARHQCFRMSQERPCGWPSFGYRLKFGSALTVLVRFRILEAHHANLANAGRKGTILRCRETCS